MIPQNEPVIQLDVNPSPVLPVLFAEFRGVQVEDIAWTAKKRDDGTTREAGAMKKATYNFELRNGMSVSAVQMGRDYEGVYNLTRGQSYALTVLRWFPPDRDKPAQLHFDGAFALDQFAQALALSVPPPAADQSASASGASKAGK